jgi:beta-lactamase regulating signal transducer with metallopeptidase domain
MWYSFLPKVLNMSLTASMVILFVLLARLVLKRAPKVFSYLLWAVVLFRLLCPVTLTSSISLLGFLEVPVTQTSTVDSVQANIVHTEAPTTEVLVPDVSVGIHETPTQEKEQQSADPLVAPLRIATYIWLLGIVTLLVYSAISLLKLRRKLFSAILLRDNIYLADYITSPFVIGFFFPKIYIPSSLSDSEQEYILLHEQYHIRRLDHVIKLLAFVALCIHWFNPLVWLSFTLSGKDMEMSCDEAVIRKIGEGIRGDYTASLLCLATGRQMFGVAPLAFGEGDTKGRIMNVLNWKKPTLWITMISSALTVLIVILCALNPEEDKLYAPEPFGHSYRVESVVYQAPQYSFSYSPETAPNYSLTSDYQLSERDNVLLKNQTNGWQSLGGMSEVTLTKDNFDRYFHVIDDISGWREEISAKKLRQDNQKAWQLILEDDPNHVFYYVLKQKNGDIYLTYGYHSEGSNVTPPTGASSIRWLFQLGRIDNVSCVVQTRDQNTYCETKWYPEGQFDFNYDDLPSAVVYDTASLTFIAPEDYDKLTVAEDYYTYPGESTGICYKETYTLLRNDEGNFVLDVTRRNDVRDENAVYYVRYGEGIYVFQLQFPVDSDSISSPRSTEESPEISSEVITEQDPLNAAITAAVLESNKHLTQGGDFACESHVILSTERNSSINEEADAVKVYVMVLYQVYDYSNSAIEIVGGSHIPTALTFYIDKEGRYTLTEYWQPRDGSYYAKDIREKFPKAIQTDALDTQKFILAQIQNCYAQAVVHGNLNTNGVIEQLFEVIAASPAESSNPGAYIDAHPIEYRELTYYGDYTLRYIFSSFLEGGKTDLMGHLMRAVMNTLLGDEAISLSVSTGQEYFDAWKELAEARNAEHGLEYMQTNAPKAYLLLQLLTETD